MQELAKSKFYQRLQSEIKAAEEAKRPVYAALQRFSGCIPPVVDAAKKISARVVEFLPQFTLHDENHLWNVLRLMEELAGEKTIQKMSPLECGLAILAAFTHDLGMALSAEELDTLSDPSTGDAPAHASAAAAAWRTYFDGHPLSGRIREARLIAAMENRALNEQEAGRLNHALGQIRSDYVRESHAREEGGLKLNRIEGWLNRIEQSLKLDLKYDGTDLSQHLALLAMSHGQSIFWLGERLTRRPKPILERTDLVHAHRVKGQEVNWAFLGWLLRLADVMDFDASRTPVVLFDHIGIRDATSRIEWQKHLSISEPPRFGQGADANTLLYVCESCPHPRIEKAIKDMLGWINAELANVRGELQRHPPARGLGLLLPSRAEVDIQSRVDGYLYQDLEFQLRREAILELLMGESLYGERSLALRELVQNALDAVHLRDLRNQLWSKLPAGKKPADMPEPHQPWDNEETPQVSITWGREQGREFIRVTDNGVGMTLGAIRSFLTQIGKSYYKSDTYRRERELMREHGLLCTPISQFGIGFLSAFMLADKVTIRTRPAGARDEFPNDRRSDTEKEAMRFPLRAEIDGPHGLIGVYPDDSIDHTGCETTLWLKSEFRLASTTPSETLQMLKYAVLNEFESPAYRAVDAYKKDSASISPIFEVASQIIWPLYPISFLEEDLSSQPLVIGPDHHVSDYLPLDASEIEDEAARWGLSEVGCNPVTWCSDEWVDSGQGGTGSRIRFAYPKRNIDAETSRGTSLHSDLLYLVQPQLNSKRIFVLVNGVNVEKKASIDNHVCFSIGVGCYLWIDFRGDAAPKLTADRASTVKKQPEGVVTQMVEVQRRWFSWISKSIGATHDWLMAATKPLRPWISPPNPFSETFSVLRPYWRTNQMLREVETTLVGDSSRLNFALNKWEIFERRSRLSFELKAALLLAHGHISKSPSGMIFFEHKERVELPGDLRKTMPLELAADHAEHLRGDPGVEAWRAAVATHLLSEAFWPSIDSALPPLAVNDWDWTLPDCNLAGPLQLAQPTDSRVLPEWLDDFDMITPLTGVPLGRFREVVGELDSQRMLRSVILLPFIFGDSLSDAWYEMANQLDEFEEVKSIMILFTGPSTWNKSFADCSESELSACSASALWDISRGTVVFADGVHTRTTLAKCGESLRQWMKKSKLPKWDLARFLQHPCNR